MATSPSARRHELRVVDPAAPVAVEAVRRFLTEIDGRFEQGYDVEAALAADAASRDDVTWVFVVATDDTDGEEPVACGGVRVLEPLPVGTGVGEIKRMWVSAGARGAGLGGRLLARLEDEARALGLGVVRLDTHPDLVEAMGLYARAGYRPIPRYNDNPDARAWFEKPLTEPSPA